MGWFSKKENNSRPAASTVAKRSLVLRQVTVYAMMTPPPELFAATYAGWSEQDRAEYRKEAVGRRDEYWSRLAAIGLGDELSPRESLFARSTMVDMSAQQHVDASWRIESVQVLMWALGQLAELPPYDQPADPEILTKLPPIEPPKFIKTAKLRPDSEIARQRDRAELWHWRSRTRQLQESGDRLDTSGQMQKIGINSFDDIVRMTARLAHEDRTLTSIIDEDFVIFGKPYRDASPEEWAEAGSIAAERHFALNWLCGYAPKNAWDDTPTDT